MRKCNIRSSEKLRKLWKDPVFRKNFNDKYPPLKKSIVMKRKWKDPEYRSKIIKKIDKVCSFCKNPIQRVPSRLRKSNFCSRKCYNSKERTIEHNNNIGKGIDKKAASIRMKRKWKDPIFISKVLRPNKKSLLEYRVEKILDNNNLGFIYNGLGPISIESKIPDFINLKNKVILEVYSKSHKDYYSGGTSKWKTQRTKLYHKAGWKVVYIERKEIKEDIIMKKLGGLLSAE